MVSSAQHLLRQTGQVEQRLCWKVRLFCLTLKHRLFHSQHFLCWQEMELLRAEESQALTTQIQLAEEAQKQARGMEMDYEEVIHLLEAEIAELKSQGVEPSLLTNKVGIFIRRRVLLPLYEIKWNIIWHFWGLIFRLKLISRRRRMSWRRKLPF